MPQHSASQAMDRMRRLTSLWNWLPGFRAVAETEHLPAASKHLRVSPSALSRTIRLLEDDVGQQLFNRVGRNLELNETGRRLLSAVRDSMRLVDEALGVMAERQYVGSVKISCHSPFTETYVLPALEALRGQHAELVPHLQSHPESEVNGMLLRGQLDLALVVETRPHPDLTTVHVADFETRVFCGPGHPLYDQPADAESYPFVVPEGEDGRVMDGWPAHLPRNISMRADLAVGVMLCRAGSHLAVLPAPVAARFPELRALPVETRSMSLHAVQRRNLGFEGRAEIVINAMLARRPDVALADVDPRRAVG